MTFQEWECKNVGTYLTELYIPSALAHVRRILAVPHRQ